MEFFENLLSETSGGLVNIGNTIADKYFCFDDVTKMVRNILDLLRNKVFFNSMLVTALVILVLLVLVNFRKKDGFIPAAVCCLIAAIPPFLIAKFGPEYIDMYASEWNPIILEALSSSLFTEYKTMAIGLITAAVVLIVICIVWKSIAKKKQKEKAEEQGEA